MTKYLENGLLEPVPNGRNPIVVVVLFHSDEDTELLKTVTTKHDGVAKIVDETKKYNVTWFLNLKSCIPESGYLVSCIRVGDRYVWDRDGFSKILEIFSCMPNVEYRIPYKLGLEMSDTEWNEFMGLCEKYLCSDGCKYIIYK